MAENKEQTQWLAFAVSTLRALNRQEEIYRIYILGRDGRAYIFPADELYENSSFYGFRNSEAKNIFAELTANSEKFNGHFISYTLDSAYGMAMNKKLAYFISDEETGISVIAETDHAETEKLIKAKVIDDLTNQYMLYPAYDRINIFESVQTFTGDSFLKTLMNEELERTEEANAGKSTEFAPVVYGNKSSLIHIRRDPVFGKYSEVLTLTEKYPDWNWHITKSHFFGYENIYPASDTPDSAAADVSSGFLIISLFGAMGIFTVFILVKNKILASSAMKPAGEKLSRMQEINFRLAEKISLHMEKEKKLDAERLELEEKLAMKTKEYKKMNEMLIAENMERTQQDHILRAEKEKAEAANVMKREFLTNTSDKLKTMVTDIKTFSEIGSSHFEEMKPEEIAELFGRIHAKGGELMSFLGLIIDLSKLEAGKTEDKISPLDFRELFAKLSYETNPLFASAESTLNIEFSSENMRVLTKCRHAELAFLHLFTYAAKNSAPGCALSLRYFPTKSLRSGVLVNAATVELGYIAGLNEFKGHSTFSLSASPDSASINISIFNEALKRCGGTFFITETDRGSIFSVVIPDLMEQQ
ncbi:MAG: hypothetical protein LRY50_07455 [Geovibrio sp.]|nr:hypothetical protein [Geovibrio sp.]